MIISHRRKWRRLSLGLVVLVLIGTLSLLSHLWTSVPDGQKHLLRQDYINPEGIPMPNDKGHALPRHDTVSRLEDNQLDVTPQGEDEITVPQDDKSALPFNDNQVTAGSQGEIRKSQDDNRPDDNQSGGVRPNDKTPDAVLHQENKNNATQVDNNKQDKILPGPVPKDVNQPDEVVLHEKEKNLEPQYDHLSFRTDHSVNVSRAGSVGENADENNIPEPGPKSPIKANLSAEEFMGRGEDNGLEEKLQMSNLPRKKFENIERSVEFGSFQSTIQASSGKDINNTNIHSGNNDVEKMLEENNIHGTANNSKTETKHALFPPSASEQVRQSLGTKPNIPHEVLDGDRNYQNSIFQQEKGFEALGQEFSKDSFLSGMRNEMDKYDFAANANQNMDMPLPTKPAFSETNENSWRADSHNSTDEFDSRVKFIRQNSSNFAGSIGTSDLIKIVSMSLYGSEPRYTIGAIRNAELVKENFPGWTLRIYMESPTSTPRFGVVPANIVGKLRSLGVDIHHIVPEQDFIPPMMWRFLVADDLSVDYFIIRDSDSRLYERDAAAVSAWIQSGKPFHSIRDHPSHAGYAVSGGLWGGRTKELRDILRRSWIDLMRGISSQYLEDMNFLNNVIWPRVQFHAYCSDSVSCDRWPNSHPFPVTRYGYDHVGQVFNEHDLGRPIDIRILRVAGENSRCIATNGL